MLSEKFRKKKEEIGITYKQIADREGLSERTVIRIINGETEFPSAEYVSKIAHALNMSLDEIITDTNVHVGDVAKLTTEIERLTSENAELQSKNIALASQNVMLKMQLNHKEEIIRLHEQYMKLLSTKD